MNQQTILLINGAQTQGVAQGQLNGSFHNAAKDMLEPHFNILETIVENGYNIAEEQEKFRQANIVIFQYPVFWFSVPAVFKRYLDEVYEMGVFFGGSEHYGEGGLMTNKHYMLSTTWNAPSEAFSQNDRFFAGNSTDDMLIGMHKAQQYVGMQALPSFSAHNVVSQPTPKEQLQQWQEHISNHLLAPLTALSA